MKTIDKDMRMWGPLISVAKIAPNSVTIYQYDLTIIWQPITAATYYIVVRGSGSGDGYGFVIVSVIPNADLITYTYTENLYGYASSIADYYVLACPYKIPDTNFDISDLRYGFTSSPIHIEYAATGGVPTKKEVRV